LDCKKYNNKNQELKTKEINYYIINKNNSNSHLRLWSTKNYMEPKDSYHEILGAQDLKADMKKVSFSSRPKAKVQVVRMVSNSFESMFSQRIRFSVFNVT